MDAVIVDKTELPALLEALAATRQLVAPVEDRTGALLQPVEDVSSIRLDYRNATLSAKGVAFPQTEKLFVFRDGVAEERDVEASEAVLFGVRPCDARALTMLDKVFRWDGIDDPYYVRRREGTVVVALSCNDPGATCFCTSVGGSPAGETGADVLATDLGDGLLLRAITGRGEALLDGVAGTARTADEESIARASELVSRAEGQLAPVRVPVDPARLEELFESDIWANLAFGCLGCAACTYSCPTCHCFDITDEERRGAGHRVRSWDTCAFPLFTAHASGHNPRPTVQARLRQRILHKFSYCPENFGEPFCVGCGRCVMNCPTGIDLRRVLATLERALMETR